MSQKLKYDETGKRYGKLLVIEYIGGGKFKCLCDCGNLTIQSGGKLRGSKNKNGVKSCIECSHILRRKKNRSEFVFGKEYSDLKRRHKELEKREGENWDIISKNEFMKIVQKECFYCGSVGSKLRKDNIENITYKFNGIDRINSKKGYSIDNVVSCCITCNRAKNNMGINEFMDWTHSIYNHIKNNFFIKEKELWSKYKIQPKEVYNAKIQ